MNKFITITKVIWNSVKIFLHITGEKDKIKKMTKIEADFKR
ncbi:hypothetical protein [Cetobacterium sp. 2A]|nr:hypothetical protein [Cetobacterium sp. 2A]